MFLYSNSYAVFEQSKLDLNSTIHCIFQFLYPMVVTEFPSDHPGDHILSLQAQGITSKL